MNTIVDLLAPYFDQLKSDLYRAIELQGKVENYLDGILLLSCHIGSYGALRYPSMRDNEAYKNIVIEYSGKKDFYENIDLLFFCQWPHSEFKSHGAYQKLLNHSEILKIIKNKYGNVEEIKTNTRYISAAEFTTEVNKNTFSGHDPKNLEEYLPLFNNSELLYRYVRCQAVHGNQFPFVNIVSVAGGKIQYEDNHAITGDILRETADNILGNLRTECIEKEKWPWEL